LSARVLKPCRRLLPDHDDKGAPEVLAHLGGDEGLGDGVGGGVRDVARRWYARDVRSYCAVSRKTDFCCVAANEGNRVVKFTRIQIAKVGPRVRARLTVDSRISTTVMQATRWFVFEVSTDRDLNDALDWLGKAHDAAR
jgi:hypothetical protein